MVVLREVRRAPGDPVPDLLLLAPRGILDRRRGLRGQQRQELRARRIGRDRSGEVRLDESCATVD